MLFLVRSFDYCGAYIGHKSGAFSYTKRLTAQKSVIFLYLSGYFIRGTVSVNISIVLVNFHHRQFYPTVFRKFDMFPSSGVREKR
jgi:hypothetical protein